MTRGPVNADRLLARCCSRRGCGSSNSTTSSSRTIVVKGLSSPARGASGGLKATGTRRNTPLPSPSAPVQSGIVPVAYRNITIQPDTLKVKVGSTIMWTNYDSVEHNVTSESGPEQFASGTFGEGRSFESSS